MLKLLKTYNTQLILLSVLSAIVLGVYTPSLFPPIKFLGDIFINLLKLFALPLIAVTLISTLGNMGKKLQELKALIRGATAYMLLSEIIAVIIALLLFNLFDPGQGVDPNLVLQGDSYDSGSTSSLTIANFLLAIVPHNIFNALAKFELLPVVIFSIIFGLGCAVVGKTAQPIIKLATAIQEVTNTCLHTLMLFAPIGIFALVGVGVAALHTKGHLESSLLALLVFVTILLAGLFIHALWQFLVVIVASKQRPGKIFKNCLPLFSTAFATASSIASLPAAMQAANNLKSAPPVTRFMLPLSASINIGGMMMYEVAAALFFSQILGVELPLSRQILLAIASILGGMAEGGIPETSMVSLVVVFKIVNVPLNAISLLLPLDRILDRIRTMVNIFGNMCGVIIVSQFIKPSSASLTEADLKP